MHLITFLLFAVGFLLLFVALTSVPFWLLWNWLMPVLFGLKFLSFIQPIGLDLLLSLMLLPRHFRVRRR
jgi:hypothetical protein